MFDANRRMPRRPRLMVWATAPLLVAGLLTVPATAAQAATVVQRHAYVYLDRPSTSIGVWYTPPEARNYNPSGNLNQVIRHDTGRYLVLMAWAAEDPRIHPGVAHVTAYGHTASYCSVLNVEHTGVEDPKSGETIYGTVALWVDCYDAAGRFADSEFTASWTGAAGLTAGLTDFAYLTAADPHSSHEPPPGEQFNSIGEPLKISHLGTGRYRVHLYGLGDKGLDPKAEKGHVQVSARSREARRCKVAYFDTLSDATQIEVNCHDADGKAADSRFSLTYSRDTSLAWTPWGAYTWVQGLEQYPDEQWTYDPLVSPPTSVTRGVGAEEGMYWVSTSMNGFMDKGNVQVTAEGPGAHYCKVAGWDPDKGIQVRCFKNGGESIRNPFFVSFAL